MVTILIFNRLTIIDLKLILNLKCLLINHGQRFFGFVGHIKNCFPLYFPFSDSLRVSLSLITFVSLTSARLRLVVV